MSIVTRTDVKGLNRFIFAEGADPQSLRLHVSQVGPGQRAHAPHTHDGQEIFYVLEGDGDVLVEEEIHRISSGEAIQINCRILHGISNAGTGPLRYAVIIAK